LEAACAQEGALIWMTASYPSVPRVLRQQYSSRAVGICCVAPAPVGRCAVERTHEHLANLNVWYSRLTPRVAVEADAGRHGVKEANPFLSMPCREPCYSAPTSGEA